jgi:predicted porin
LPVNSHRAGFEDIDRLARVEIIADRNAEDVQSTSLLQYKLVKKKMNKWRRSGLLGFFICMSAHAQSSITLYGVIDTYLGYNNAAGKGAIVGMNGGGDMANRFGLRGTEDLGGGLHANFTLENGFYSESGALATPGSIFNRQAWVGLSGNFGEFRFGVQNSPQYLMMARFDAFDGATYGSGLVNFTTFVPRYSNVISYQTPVISDITVRLEVAPGNQPGSLVDGTTFLTSIEYQKGPLYLGANYVDSRSLTGLNSTRSGVLGGAYTLGRGTIHAAVYRGNNPGATATRAGVYYTTWSLSGEYMFTPADRVSVGAMAAQGSGSNGDAQQASLMYQHILSTRTLIYGVATHIFNHGNAAFYLHGAGPVPANVPVEGGGVTGIQVGIRHLF